MASAEVKGRNSSLSLTVWMKHANLFFQIAHFLCFGLITHCVSSKNYNKPCFYFSLSLFLCLRVTLFSCLQSLCFANPSVPPSRAGPRREQTREREMQITGTCPGTEEWESRDHGKNRNECGIWFGVFQAICGGAGGGRGGIGG